MHSDQVIILGGMVLVSGETGARAAEIVLDGARNADNVPPGLERTADACR